MILVLAGCGDSEALAPPAGSGIERVELGSFTTDDEGFVDVPYEVPEAAVSSLLGCGPYGYDRLATAAAIASPAGTIYDDAAPGATPVRVSTSSDFLPVLLPVSPDLDLQPGKHTATLAFEAPDYPVTTECEALYRVAEARETGALDLDLVFVGVDGVVEHLNEEDFESAPGFADVVDAYSDFLGTAGLSLGELRPHDFTGDVSTYTHVEGEDELGALLRFTAADAQSVTIFFVQDIDLGDGASILGRAGGSPGMVATGGNSKAGVVVSVANWLTDPAGVALVMAHETGHFLGLFHTTETTGDAFDPIGDTPECPQDDGAAEDGDCAGKGVENLMWWNYSPATMESFSADQAWVLQRSAVVR